MNKSLSAVKKQIAKLQAQADALVAKEKAEVIARIKPAIEAYGITPEDLFGASPSAAKAKGLKKAKLNGAAKYSDDQGNTWSGRGPHPKWIRDAIASGRALEEFMGGAAASEKAGPSARKRGSGRGRAAAKTAGARRSTAGTKVPVMYRDSSGNQWSGRGSQPRWLKQAIASGKQLEDFKI